MKINTIIFLIIAANSFLINSQEEKNNDIFFAEIKGESYEFKIDTLAFKNSISNSLFSKESKGTYDKIEIQKLKTVGDIIEDYYRVVLYHFGKNLKTARYLYYNAGKLYLNSDNSFNSLYNSCLGVEKKCSPNVVLNSKLEMGWICSNKVGICSIDEKECQSYKTLILN